MTAPTVDVVVDNYNYGRYLRAAIDSALSQSQPCERVVVVDDGSTDDSREVICSYGDRIVPVFKENGGQASAFNAGFEHSRADAVIFLDADDVLAPRTVARVARALSDQPATAKFQYRLEVIDRAGRPTGAVKPPAHLPLPSGDVSRHELILPFDLTWLPTSGNAFPRWVLERLLPIPEQDFAAAADWYLQHVPPLLGPVVSFDWIGGGYRQHGANSYEPSASRLDLTHVRQSVVYAAATRRQLERVADELHLERPREILSVADLSNRLVSRRLDPARHPLADDRVPMLVLRGWRAAGRRFDVAPLMRLMFAVWFAAFAALPRPAARRLAERFMFPERRAGLNQLLARLHRNPLQP